MVLLKIPTEILYIVSHSIQVNAINMGQMIFLSSDFFLNHEGEFCHHWISAQFDGKLLLTLHS